MIELSAIYKSYQLAGTKLPVLKDINLSIGKGQKTAIVGKSGSGKTTLLNILTGIDKADEGEINLNGEYIHKYDEAQLARWRRNEVGIVFQFYHLFETLNVWENVLLPMELANKLKKSQQKVRALDLLEKVGLADLKHKFPYQLSGGEKQRVAIARSLANDPNILAADEPTGNLDSQTSEQINEIFDQLHQEGKTLLIVTHEAIKEEDFDQIIRLSDGQISEL